MLSEDAFKLLVILLIERAQRRRKVVCLILAHLILQPQDRRVRQRGEVRPYGLISRLPEQHSHLGRLCMMTNSACVDNLRMDRNTFARLCMILRDLGGLKDQRYVGVEEQVSMFLSILSHHKKQRVISFDYIRSTQTVSFYMHVVLKAVLKLHNLFLVKPTPVPLDSDNTRWKWFKGCLGALDGTHIDVIVPYGERAKFRTRKGRISTNVLGVCNTEMQFVYFLPGWEGSAADSRVLRDAVTRPHGLKVPKGQYYLCDNGYANAEGFLAPYRGCRYHLKEWGPNTGRPSSPQEHFNFRHTRARNVIERAFGVLKKRFAILRSPAFYPLDTQVRIIMACFLLHNFIRRQMDVDPVEQELDEDDDDEDDEDDDETVPEDVIDTVESSPEFNQWRDQLSVVMFQEWRHPT